MIQVYIEPDKQLTTHIVMGKVLFAELIDVIEKYYTNNPTTYALWDLREADLSGLLSNEVREIVLTTKEYVHARSNGKTAIVASDDLSFGIGRMYENLAEVYELSIDYQIFRVYDDAIHWLFE